MTKEIRIILAALLMLLGLGLMVGGIITGKDGAVVVGLCVAAAAAQQGVVLRRQNRPDDQHSHH